MHFLRALGDFNNYHRGVHLSSGAPHNHSFVTWNVLTRTHVSQLTGIDNTMISWDVFEHTFGLGGEGHAHFVGFLYC